MKKFGAYIFYCLLFGIIVSCATPRVKNKERINDYLFWIRKKPETKKFIDYEDEYWFLEHTNRIDPRNVRIDGKEFIPFYIPFDLINNVSICCKDPLYTSNLEMVKSEYKLITSDGIIDKRSLTIKYLEYMINVYAIPSQAFCKCTLPYSGVNSKVILKYAYPVEDLDFSFLTKTERRVIKNNIKNIIDHPEIFGSD